MKFVGGVKVTLGAALAGFLLFLIPGVGGGQERFKDPMVGDRPDAEFHMARMIYRTSAYAGSHGYRNPMWAVDYPLAEAHFLPTLRRYTKVDVAENTRHLELGDPLLFKFPYLWLQQPAAGRWNPTKKEAEFLREYLARGGFMIVDDFWGEGEWDYFEEVMKFVLPDKNFENIPDDDSVRHLYFDIDNNTPIPGDRHVGRMGGFGGFGGGGGLVTPTWRGIYDDHRRLMVIASLNADMGDAWEHADDPEYPLKYTGFAYQLGVNYVLYAMSH